jgi:hypothetical protein
VVGADWVVEPAPAAEVTVGLVLVGSVGGGVVCVTGGGVVSVGELPDVAGELPEVAAA